MHTAEFGGEHLEHAQLAGDPLLPPIAPPAGSGLRIRMDELPDPRDKIGVVLGQQSVQKRRAGARQAGNEDRPLDRLFEDRRRPQLFVAQPQQIGQKAADVPARAKASKEAQIRFFGAGAQKDPQSLPERRIAKISQPGLTLRPCDQLVGIQLRAKKSQHLSWRLRPIRACSG